MTVTTSGTVTTTTDKRQLTDGSGANGGPGTTFGQKPADAISHYGVTPVVQPAQPTAPSVATGSVGSGTAAYLNTTYTGGTGTSAYSTSDIVTALKALGLLAA